MSQSQNCNSEILRCWETEPYRIEVRQDPQPAAVGALPADSLPRLKGVGEDCAVEVPLNPAPSMNDPLVLLAFWDDVFV